METNKLTTHLFLFPGLWTNSKDYALLLEHLQECFNAQGSYVINYNNLLRKYATYTYTQAYRYTYSRFSKTIQRLVYQPDQNAKITLVIVGHSLGGALALRLASDIIKNKPAGVHKVIVLALNPAGLKMNPYKNLFRYWLTTPLKMALKPKLYGSISKSIRRHIKRHGILAPLRLLFSLSKENFLGSTLIDLSRRPKWLSIHIVVSTKEDTIDPQVFHRIISMIKPNSVITVSGTHTWPLNKHSVLQFVTKLKQKALCR